jgi:hypothetical protein
MALFLVVVLLFINLALSMRILGKVELLIIGERLMANSLDVITAQVTANTTVIGSAIVLIGQLSDLISSLKDDPVALQALADQLKAQDDALAASLVAHAPAQ